MEAAGWGVEGVLPAACSQALVTLMSWIGEL